MRLDPIVMSPYNPRWPQSFGEERDHIEPVLSPWLVRPIEHIGSTSIPGMPAKPIIDMVAVIGVIEDVLGAIHPMSVLGWLQAPEPTDDEHRRRSFCTPSIANRTHHLHVVKRRRTNGPDCWRSATTYEHIVASPLRTLPSSANWRRFMVSIRIGESPIAEARACSYKR